MNTTEISVVIPARHRNEQLALCLECLAPGVQTLPFERYEVIVTDDGANSNAKAMIEERFPWVQWVSGPQRGPAANRNNGARLAKSPWIAFTDDDCLPQANWLETMVNNTDNDEIGALEGAISATGHAKTQFTECPVNEEGGCFWTANVAVRKEIFNSIGGFDENYPIAAHEDQDLCIRLKKCTSIKFVREAVVLHPIRDIELRAYFFSRPARARAYAIHLAKHRPPCSSCGLLFELQKAYLIRAKNYLLHRKLKAGAVMLVESLIMVPMTFHHFLLLRKVVEYTPENRLL